MSSSIIEVFRKVPKKVVKKRSLKAAKTSIPLINPGLVEAAVSKAVLFGQGTYGACYFYKDKDGTPLCVKVLHPKDINRAEIQKLIVAEAKSILRLKDIPGMIRLVGISLAPTPAIVTKYAGETLCQFLKEERITEFDAVDIMKQIAHIMCELTKAGLCHADLKSNNIVLTYKGNALRVTIIDVGMMNEFGFNLNWNVFMERKQIYAPEIYEGKPLSRASQVYQVGSVLMRILMSFKKIEKRHARLYELLRLATDAAKDRRPAVEELLECVKVLYNVLIFDALEMEVEKEQEEKKSKKRKMTEDRNRENAKEIPFPEEKRKRLSM